MEFANKLSQLEFLAVHKKTVAKAKYKSKFPLHQVSSQIYTVHCIKDCVRKGSTYTSLHIYNPYILISLSVPLNNSKLAANFPQCTTQLRCVRGKLFSLRKLQVACLKLQVTCLKLQIPSSFLSLLFLLQTEFL